MESELVVMATTPIGKVVKMRSSFDWHTGERIHTQPNKLSKSCLQKWESDGVTQSKSLRVFQKVG
jgi:hypothetical protein